MSKKFKSVGCELQNGDRLVLRRVEDRFKGVLVSVSVELAVGEKAETVLATGQHDIEARLGQLALSSEDREWMLAGLRSAVRP